MAAAEAEPAAIVHLITSGPRNGVHETDDIAKLIDECDATSIAHFVDEETALTLPDLCRLILHHVPANLDAQCQRGRLQVLKSCAIIEQMAIVDEILCIVAEYTENAEFCIEYEAKPRCVTYVNTYFCEVTKVILSKHLISVHFEEHGDVCNGNLQYPTDSRLTLVRGRKYPAVKKYGCDIQYTSFYEYDVQVNQVKGVVTFDWPDLYLLSQKQLCNLQFTYGGDEYFPAKLLSRQNQAHCELLERYLFYYQ